MIKDPANDHYQGVGQARGADSINRAWEILIKSLEELLLHTVTVRCSGRDEPYSNDAISLIRHKIMQRDVEIEVETVYRTWTFIGSLWESITNVGTILLEVVAGALYDEGVVKVVSVVLKKEAVMVVHAVLMDCKLLLGKS
ncbi:ribonuclease TUDOR 1-like protein [Tanacetum coccineum]